MAKAKVRKLFSAERKLLEARKGSGADIGPPAAGAPVAVDLSEVMKAIKVLQIMVETRTAPNATSTPDATVKPDNLPKIETLNEQLCDLRDHIEETKKEIASIRHPDEQDDHLTNAALELGAIVEVTEQATHHILNATEEIDELVEKIKERSGDVGAHALLDELSGKTIEILEACNFQDISGQRINKVVKIINFLEERILSMIDIWGADGFAEVDVNAEVLEGDAALLQGPQHAGKGINQDDIDALFD